jgi:hypothetical protein
MNAIESFRHSALRHSGKHALAVLMIVLPLAVRAGGVVTIPTEANLRAAMAGGGLVTFACDGTIKLTSTITNEVNTALDASGHQITISGNDSVRVFFVNSNVSFTALNVIIASGRSDKGAGVLNDGGTLMVEHCLFAFNTAVGQSAGDPGDDGCGGALFNTGVSSIASSTFATNRAYGGPGDNGANTNGGFGRRGGSGQGGAICNFGLLTIDSCSLQANSAQGGRGGDGIPGSVYPSPRDPPGSGGDGGHGWGGAIFSTNELVVRDSLFVWNQSRGGTAGGGGPGGFQLYGEPNGEPRGGPGGDGGSGCGSALWSSNGVVRISNCTLANNEVAGGLGGSGGRGGGTVKYNGGTGGDGGDGGMGLGVIYAFGDGRMTNCTIASNVGTIGSGGIGGAGGLTGGIPAPPGSNGLDGVSIGGVTTVACRMANTLLATNTPGGNSLGQIVDDGGNLSSDDTCAFTKAGSLNNTDPKLGPLADNRGPTLTMALLAGSPAIDAGDSTSAPPADQRGVPRPFGAAADIGAYEYAPLLSINRAQESGLEVLLRDGSPGQTCRLLTSTDLSNWWCVATNQVGANGMFHFQTNCNATEPQRFYKVVLP